MGDDDAVRALAAKAPNFGYLLQHEPALVVHGAGAESYVFSDPNVAMIKARQFGDALAAAVFLKFGVPGMPDKQYKRLNLLLDLRIVDARVHRWFDEVRLKGNEAAHEGYADARVALLLVRACYELGAWFHRTVDRVLGEQGRAGSFGPSGSGNTGAAGSRGAAGMAGGAGAGAGRGEGADDLEHTTKYAEPNDEAFGDDRMVAPPVIGG